MAIPSLEIEQVIRDWYRRIELGEMIPAAEDTLSRERGFLALGTDDSEWFGDRADLIKAYGDAAGLGNPVISVQKLKAFQEGSVGWAVDIVSFKRPGKGSISMRHTFVLHMENGRWKVVHAHYSFPAPDE